MVASKPTFDGVSAAKERTFVLIPWDFPTLQAPQRTSCAFAGGVGHPRRLEIPGSRKLDWGRPPMSTIRTGDARFCTSSAPCEGTRKGLPLDGGAEMGPGLLVLPRFRCKRNRASPRQARPLATFHRQMAVFREQVREIPTKYKMLWFVVDTYHGQRYFFICGFKRTVT